MTRWWRKKLKDPKLCKWPLYRIDSRFFRPALGAWVSSRFILLLAWLTLFACLAFGNEAWTQRLAKLIVRVCQAGAKAKVEVNSTQSILNPLIIHRRHIAGSLAPTSSLCHHSLTTNTAILHSWNAVFASRRIVKQDLRSPLKKRFQH